MDEKEFGAINVIPFIDIMLVLLTIVLTTSTFIASGAIKVNIPRASGSQAVISKNVIIEIDRQGGISVNSRRVALEDLKSSFLNTPANTPLLIRADRDIALQVFVDVMDTLKKTGFMNISLQTENR